MIVCRNKCNDGPMTSELDAEAADVSKETSGFRETTVIFLRQAWCWKVSTSDCLSADMSEPAQQTFTSNVQNRGNHELCCLAPVNQP